jgi:(2Fe-2S) ferredoxin
MAKLTTAKLDQLKESHQETCDNCIKVGMSTCGIAAGAEDVYNLLQKEIKKRKLDINVKKCGCVGMCCAEPLVEVKIEGLPNVLYGNVDKDVAMQIINNHIENKKLVHDFIYEISL